MTSNPTDGIRLMQFDEVTKAILSLKEIQKLAITPVSYTHLDVYKRQTMRYPYSSSPFLQKTTDRSLYCMH